MTYTDPTTCPDCPWERFTGDQQADQRDLAKHRHNRHGQPLPWASATPAPRSAAVDWRTQAIDALILLARSRATFTIFEVLEFGACEPPDPTHDWGRFTKDAKQLELIRKVGGTESKRPGTARSMTGLWTAGPAIVAGLKPSSERSA